MRGLVMQRFSEIGIPRLKLKQLAEGATGLERAASQRKHEQQHHRSHRIALTQA